MDLLKFGMENEDSKNISKRMAAKAALAAERIKADVYEKYLEMKHPDFPENPLRDQLMLQRILEQAEAYEKEQAIKDKKPSDEMTK